MVYDFEENGGPPRVVPRKYDSTDLEILVTVLTVAAIYLSPLPESEFTLEELLEEAKKLDPELNDRDAIIVLGHMPALKRTGNKLRFK